MAALSACPQVNELKRLTTGNLPLGELESLVEHLEACDGCLAKVQTLPCSDTLVEVLGKTKTLAGNPDEPIVTQLITRLKELAKTSASAEQRTVPPDPVPESGAGQNEATAGAASSPTAAESSLIDFLAPSQAADELGRLGKYRILKILGHGGMGVVYKGEDLKLKRTVAIKAMLPALAASANNGKRFLREAEAMAAVEHDHIVRIYQIDEDRGIPFLAMEFLKGESLDDLLKREEPIALADVLRIGREIAEGLSAAHTTHLIHRDIKPGNIWLEAPRNRVKILDFGLARAASQDSGLTQQGAIIGTPAYMAPEQGRGADVDARCDLFSLGVVLYRMCTGHQPFNGTDTISTLMAVALTEPVAPIKVNAALPQALSDLVMKLLEKEPAQRVATAAEVIQTIQQIEKELASQKPAEEKTATLDIAPSPRATRQPALAGRAPISRRRSAVLVAVAALGAALLLGAGGVIFYWQTNNGIVRIEVNDPDIQVTLGDKDVTFKDNKQEIKLTPGAHGLHVKRGPDFEFDTPKFILNKGEMITLKVEWFEKGKLQVVRANEVLGAKERPKVEVTAAPPLSGEYALAFEKGSSARLATPIAHDTDSYTLEGWYLLEKQAVGNARLIGVGDTYLGVSFGAEDADDRFYLYQGNNKGKGAKNLRSDKITLGRWHHVAAVRAGDETRLFVDGKRVGTGITDVPATIKMLSFQASILAGSMKEVRISKTARYSTDFTPARRFEPDKDTLALYHFDEGSGDTLKDSSGNGYDGKIVGAKWVKADGSPIAAPPPGVYLDDLREKKYRGHLTLGKHGIGSGGAPFAWQGKTYPHGLVARTPIAKEKSKSLLVYDLAGRFESLQGTAGIYDSKSNSVLTFRIVGDGRQLWESKPLENSGDGQEFQVSLRGVNELRLEVTSSGATVGHAVWIEPRLVPQKEAERKENGKAVP